MSDKETRDLARREKKNNPTPQKNKQEKISNFAKKENKSEQFPSSKKTLDFQNCEVLVAKLVEDPPKNDIRVDENENCFDHPVYKEIARQNGLINRSDLSFLKNRCMKENIDSSGKINLVKQRLKNHLKTKLLREVGLLKPTPYRGYDFLLVVDFEATCESKNLSDYPHEIIEFPGVLVNARTGEVMDSWREYVRPVINSQLSEFCTSLTGIQQETVDKADTFAEVLARFTSWLETHGLGHTSTFALVTDGPFDVGRFLRLSCDQADLAVPLWAQRWVNLRKGFANFYRSNTGSHLKLPGLQTMLEKLDLEFEGSPHSGLDDARNIARVVSRMVADGAVLKVNERLEPNPEVTGRGKEGMSPNDHDRGRGGTPGGPRGPGGQLRPRLQHVAPVSRTQADHWLNECRNRLIL